MHHRLPATIASNAILRSTLLARALACAAVGLVVTSAHAGGATNGAVTITGSSRSISWDYLHRNDYQSTSELGAWSAENGLASQVSTVDAAGMAISGSAGANPSIDGAGFGMTVSFTISIPVAFSLEGGISGVHDDFEWGLPVNSFPCCSWFELQGPNGVVFQQSVEPGWTPFSDSGTLAPGDYVFTAGGTYVGYLCCGGQEMSSESGSVEAVLTLTPTFAEVAAGPVVNPVNCHEYLLLAPSSWEVAEATAVALGGTLAIINDAAENAWIRSTFPANGDYLWVGLSDVASEGQFVWADGSPLAYSNWASGQPDDWQGAEDCVHLLPDGKWNDIWCPSSYLRGVVEIPTSSSLADLNGDSSVDGADLGLLLASWGGECVYTSACPADIVVNGYVDGADLGVLLAEWGSAGCP